MILKFKEFYPVIHSSAWIAPSADLIGNIEIGEIHQFGLDVLFVQM